jgi:hypothetical protein
LQHNAEILQRVAEIANFLSAWASMGQALETMLKADRAELLEKLATIRNYREALRIQGEVRRIDRILALPSQLQTERDTLETRQ